MTGATLGSGSGTPAGTIASQLTVALRRRRDIIADHAWRDRDSAGHLEALRQVSCEIEACISTGAGVWPARLLHFLERRSYDKALLFLETGEAPHEHHAH